MWNAMVQLCLVRICFCVRLRDTFRHHVWVTLFVASVFAVRALHASSILEELATKRTTHDVVELLLHEFVAVLLDNVLLSLANGTLSSERSIEGLLVSCVFHCILSVKRSVHRKGKPYQKTWSNVHVLQAQERTNRR